MSKKSPKPDEREDDDSPPPQAKKLRRKPPEPQEDLPEIEEDDEEKPSPPPTALDEQYQKQMRQITYNRLDLAVLTIRSQIKQTINLRPDFQRRDRWNTERRSRFIESIIMNVPIPPVFLGEEDYGKYSVLDGRQRLTAVYRFLRNNYRLRKLKVWKKLNGMKYEDLQREGIASFLERRFIPAIVIARESSPEVKYDVFDRLNTGGVTANPMEVRNAIFPGRFNLLLHELSAMPLFRRLWGIPIPTKEDSSALKKNGYYQKMTDLEVVLRFFALAATDLEGASFKEHLSNFMAARTREYAKDPSLYESDRKSFLTAIENCAAVLGVDAFRRVSSKARAKKGKPPRPQHSRPYADALMLAFADYPADTFTQAASERAREGIKDLEQLEDFRAAVEKGTNSERAIQTRVSLARSAVRRAVRGK